MNRIILILLLNFVSIYSQIESAKRLLGNEIYGDDMIFTSYDISTNNNDIYVAWLNSSENNLTTYTDTIYFAITNDFGDTFTQYHSFSFVDYKFYKNSTVRLIQNGENISIYFFAEEFKNNISNNGIYYLSSDDNGNTWSDITKLANVYLSQSYYKFDLFVNEAGNISFVYYKSIPQGIYYQYSTDNGISWTELKISSTKTTTDITAVESNNNEFRIYFLAQNNSDVNELRELLSTDNGATWGEKVIMPYLLDDSFILGKRRYINAAVNNQTVHFAYEMSSKRGLKKFTYNLSNQIVSEVQSLTNYKGINNSPELFVLNNEVNFGCITDKEKYSAVEDGTSSIWVNNYLNPIDTKTYPVIEWKEVKDNLDGDSKRILNTKVIDDNLKEVYALVNSEKVILTDDGIFPDLTSNDTIYSGELILPYSSNSLVVLAVDSIDNLSKTDEEICVVYPGEEKILIDKGRLKIPIDNHGVIADVDINYSGAGGFYDNKVILFSGGFFLTGEHNGMLFGNGVLTASRIKDYIPGKVQSALNDEREYIYKLAKVDKDFSASWLQWQTAVELGANFYDGDNDGIYNPVDKNNNGKWDEDEDRPDLIGEETYWYIINDGLPTELRRFTVAPKGIEIKVTLFTSKNGISEAFDNTIFIRYEIENTGTVADKFEDVYFSFAQDPDIGEYQDDLVGSDVKMSSCYAYNDGDDAEFGLNAPTLLMSFLEGPINYWKGKSYEDVNGNDIYDEGIDTPLDTAQITSGNYMGRKILPGAINMPLHSFTQYMQAHPTHGDPDTYFELRNYQLGGKSKGGDSLYISNWNFGNGNILGTDSTLYPSKYMYWGDPETQTGWLNTVTLDQRLMATTGPFDLEAGKPKTVLGALIVARGNSPVNSVTLAKEYLTEVLESYTNNFEDIPVGVEKENNIPLQFSLSQNYPNPFNPTTNIEYSIPNVETLRATSQMQNVTLKVYDILGREVAVLVNEQQSAGKYRVNFNASNLASGVYMYQLKSGNHVSSKKMLLLK